MQITCFPRFLLLAAMMLISCDLPPKSDTTNTSKPDPAPGRWAKTYGGSESETPSRIRHTDDGGYILSGYTSTFWVGAYDLWVVKLQSDGEISWQRSYGDVLDDCAYDIRQTADGGYIVVGSTKYFTHHTFESIWLLKLSSYGEIEWQRTYGGGGTSYSGVAVLQTPEGGYVVAGHTGYFNDSDIIVLKLAADGRVSWQKTYGAGFYYSRAASIEQADDGGFVVCGYTRRAFGSGDEVWVLKLSSNGDLSWNRTYGDAEDDIGMFARQVESGSFLVTGAYGSGGAWIIKLNHDGSIIWQKTYGDHGMDNAIAVLLEDDGYSIGGNRYRPYGCDLWILKLDFEGGVIWQTAYGSSASDEAYGFHEAENDGYVITGRGPSGSFGIPCCGSDIWVVTVPADGQLPGADFVTNLPVTVSDTAVTPGQVSDPLGIIDEGNAAVSDTSVLALHTNAVVRTQYP